MAKVIVCQAKSLPREKLAKAAETAVKINPLNRAPVFQLGPDFHHTQEGTAVMTMKYWGMRGIKLTVGFMDAPPAVLRKRLLVHMNVWARTSNVQFVETKADPQVRVARDDGDNGGYWSYVGTDIQHIAKNMQTMNLEGFTVQTVDREFQCVVRHLAGHTLGFPHEHIPSFQVARIDVQKAIEYFGRTEGWSPDEVKALVLAPLEESSLLGTVPDTKSIMCYQIPGDLTLDGKPILPCMDMTPSDYALAAKIYPPKKLK
jgi:hypothetical protein